jgi:hypothetical protein
MDDPHRRNEVADKVLISGGHDFITNSNIIDPCLRMERGDTCGHPLASVVKVRKRRDFPIANGDSHEDASISKGLENIRVGVKDFDAVYGGSSLEKVGYLSWWWKVIAKGAIVYAYGV